jgi:hypothetical protein
VPAQQVPTVSLDVQEYCHLSIGLDARGADESDPGRDHPCVCCLEIVDTEEQADTAGELLADDRHLMLAVRACEQNAGPASGGTNNDPAFWPAIVRQRRDVFYELELQDAYEEINCRVVLSNDQGNQLEV